MKKKTKQQEDRLSRLPDELIHHVMSFLETKHAVRTCVLSKRWQFLWKSLPYLHFHHAIFERQKLFTDESLKRCQDRGYVESRIRNFSHFIHQVIERRLPIDLVKVKARYDYCFFRVFSTEVESLIATAVESLIRYAIEHQVQELDIGVHSSKYIEFPLCFTSCQLLTRLKLSDSCGRGYKIEKLHFPALQSLLLVKCGAGFYKNQEFYVRILSSCPNLQTLKLVDCFFNGFNSLSIRAPNLKKLKISYTYDNEFFYPHGFKVLIDAPKLTTFRFDAYHMPMLFLIDKELASLDEVYFDLQWDKKDFTYTHEDFLGLVNTFKQFSNVKSLTLSLQSVKALVGLPALVEESQLQFPNLKYLKLIVDREGDFLIPTTTSLLNRFLSSSPLLRICVL